MMKRITLLSILWLASRAGFCTVVTITNSGFNFSPATVTVTSGDSVRFTVSSNHKPVEVSEATWNANDNTPLSGGFNLPFGGGLVVPAQLSVGTHFYVCDPHASGGMKGKIIVQSSTATEDIHFPASVSVYPNPSNGRFQLMMKSSELSKKFDLFIYNAEGKNVFLKHAAELQTENSIDLTGFDKGIYMLNLSDGRKNYTKQILIQ